MIKLFIIDEYYVVFIIDNENTQIYCTNFSKCWSISEKVCNLQSNFIDEIIDNKKLTNDDIEISLQTSENFINMKVLKLKTETIKIKLGDFKLLPYMDEKAVEKLFQLIFQEIEFLTAKNNKTESLLVELQEENVQLRKDFKGLTDNVLSRENKILNKACFLLNEKKKKIRELENDLICTPSKCQKLSDETLDNEDAEEEEDDSSDCHSSLSCSFVKDEVIVVDNDNTSELNESANPEYENNNQTGNNSEDELFPETDKLKLTAVPMKKRVKENIAGIPENHINDNKLNETVGKQNRVEKNLNYDQQPDILNENLVSGDLYNLM